MVVTETVNKVLVITITIVVAETMIVIEVIEVTIVKDLNNMVMESKRKLSNQKRALMIERKMGKVAEISMAMVIVSQETIIGTNNRRRKETNKKLQLKRSNSKRSLMMKWHLF